MHRAHIPALPWQEQCSPSRKFQSYYRDVSLALGGIRGTGTWGGGHPFDVQIRRVPPGASICPFHLHLGQWEFFFVQKGSGTVRVGTDSYGVAAEDFFIHPPGEPHQLTNTGSVDLEVLIVADNPPLDAVYYPDSDKWALRPPTKVFRMTEVDYFAGEDDAPASTESYRPMMGSIPPPNVPFLERKRNLAGIPWDTWSSPKQQFRGASKELSIALGAKRKTPSGLGGHPFEVELGMLEPGRTGCPFHSHAAQFEFFLIVRGSATIRINDARLEFKAGDVCMQKPGTAHQIVNADKTEPLEFLLIADNPPADYWYYPDSNKWGFPEPRMFFRPAKVDYYEGEE